MRVSSKSLASLILVLVSSVANGDPLVPALIIFGDSVVDVGNNNNIVTVIKANFLPYGRDFVTHRPTGRFCNGKLATDFTAELLGFASYPPAYLGQDARGNALLTGANFASAASGLYDTTAAITLFGVGSNQCVERLNQDAIAFNNKLNTTSESLLDKMPGLKLVVFDINEPLLEMIRKPIDYGKLPAPVKHQRSLRNFKSCIRTDSITRLCFQST